VQMFGTPAAVAASSAPVQTITSPSEPTAPALAKTEPVVEPAVPETPATVVVAPTPVSNSQLVLGTEADSILPPAPASWWQHLIVSPKAWLKSTYYALGFLIIALLAFITEFEFRRHHLRHVAAGAVLIVLMVALFILGGLFFFTAPVIAAQG
jgi:hypothetical protein